MWTWWLIMMAALATPQELDLIRDAINSHTVIRSDGVSAKQGELPDYQNQAGLAIRTQCRVWLRLEAGDAAEVVHENCPKDLQPAIDTCLMSSSWQKTGVTDLNGLLPLDLTHIRDGNAPQSTRAMFRPATLHPVAKKIIPKSPGGDLQTCRALVSVSGKGVPENIVVQGCDEDKARSMEKTLKKWRWTPLEIGNEPMTFEVKLSIKL